MIVPFSATLPDDLARVGGKGQNLGALTRAGFPVPPGFCVTTAAYRRFVAGCPTFSAWLDRLDALDPDDVAGARELGAAVRDALLAVPLPEEVVGEITTAHESLGREHAYAVRSSATAEDLPGASFAGQQDTYLNIRGGDELLAAVRRCFASLFTDRAILYRARNGFGHRQVALAVVVQRMVVPDASGILFTADPVTGHRGTLTIDAGYGLGEALVGGLVTADLYRVDRRTGALKELRVGDKQVAIRPVPGGGTVTEDVPEDRRRARVLDDAAVAALADLGARVEAHYGGVPQDLEWCLEGHRWWLVQARPITSLYPLPAPGPDDGAVHLYLSFGHAQNMTDPITPMGRDLWRAVFPIGKTRMDELPCGATTMVDAGSRLFLDITPVLRLGPTRRLMFRIFRAVYPDVGARLATLVDRPEIQAAARPRPAALGLFARMMWRVPLDIAWVLLGARLEDQPAWADRMVAARVAGFRRAVEAEPPGVARLRAARQALTGLFQVLPEIAPRLVSGLLSLGRLRRRFADSPYAADVEALQRGLVGNVTTEMDLRVGDLADLARPFPELRAALEHVRPGELHRLRELPGGPVFLDALAAFLDRFGMRGQAEIDIGRPRWADDPGLLLASIRGIAAHGDAPGQHRRHFATLQAEAEAAAQRLVAAAPAPVRWLVRRQVQCVRHCLGLREHPKYLFVQCFEIVRSTVLAAADALVRAGRIAAAGDVWFLTYDELLELAADANAFDPRPRIVARRADHEHSRHLNPPLVVTSEGEVPARPVPKDLPEGAIAGLGASAGVVEGIARVVLDPAAEVLRAGEILVAPYTDPGWTPLFVHAAGLVCDVGGMMTHGSVIAREYGIPAVVGVGDGTRRLKSGQRLRVDGGRGIVEVLAEAAP
ncbi:pyruvate, water dikinase [Nannocystis exedens]|uniref:Pyruvate, water dikinase n=1 Tax=Nannocystis exedens TaxID=54 RepID=A0A1I2I2Q8_9BACT|nr:phosphoenolpyruvate synthase [Nannocystis exedens]PCC74913.1 phosphoenolpyruvate synthase [Nannocystis exedens]SFF36532.1 pyruvate, water dikinase [Nannocystis exedens]